MPDTQPEKEKQPDTGSVTTHSPRGNIHCITIIGTIEGHQEAPETTKTTKYLHVRVTDGAGNVSSVVTSGPYQVIQAATGAALPSITVSSLSTTISCGSSMLLSSH